MNQLTYVLQITMGQTYPDGLCPSNHPWEQTNMPDHVSDVLQITSGKHTPITYVLQITSRKHTPIIYDHGASIT